MFKENKNKYTANIVFKASFVGLIIISIVIFTLWYWCGWEFWKNTVNIHDLLSTVIQVFAGILAIAISFALIYVQISLDTYSLRSSIFLSQHRFFKRLVFDYTLMISLLGGLYLITEEFIWLSKIIGFICILFLILGLFDLIKFIEEICMIITPESIIRDAAKNSNKMAIAEDIDYERNLKKEY